MPMNNAEFAFTYLAIDHINKLTDIEVAKLLAGNWRDWEGFFWNDAPSDAERWSIICEHGDGWDYLMLWADTYKQATESTSLLFLCHQSINSQCRNGIGIRVMDRQGNVTDVAKDFISEYRWLADFISECRWLSL